MTAASFVQQACSQRTGRVRCRSFSKDVPTPSQASQRLKLTVAYDGTSFAGFQWQKSVRTVQSELEAAASKLFLSKSRVVGASRTDSGVHARGQVVHMDVYGERDVASDLVQYNGLLPDDVKVLDIEVAPEGFDAQFQSTGKEYHYRVASGLPDPLQARQQWWVYGRWCEGHRGKPRRVEEMRLDAGSMREAARLLVGTRDFTAFADVKRAPGMGALKRKKPKLAALAAEQGGQLPVRDAQKNTRTLWKVEVVEEGPPGNVRIEMAGDGFLYRMVRVMAAALVEVGHGRLTPKQLAAAVASGDRSKLPEAAPPHGLCLMQIFYSDTNPFIAAAASAPSERHTSPPAAGPTATPSEAPPLRAITPGAQYASGTPSTPEKAVASGPLA